MKRILTIIAAAVAALSLSSCTTEEDYVYIIADSVESYTLVGTDDDDAYQVVKEFTQAVIAFEKKYASDWQWKVVIKNNKSGNADSNALEKYNKYKSEFAAIIETYQAKLDACSAQYAQFEETLGFKLTKVNGGGYSVMANELFGISYNYDKCE